MQRSAVLFVLIAGEEDQMPNDTPPARPRIEDYAFVGDCNTGALIGRDGAVDWLCWPRFDSDACLAALLGTEEHGCWKLAPVRPARTQRRY